MQKNSLTTATLPLDTAAWRWTFESGSPFRGEVSPLNLFKRETSAFDQTYQILLADANQELADLLRDVGAKNDAAPGNPPQAQSFGERLTRAVEYAVKQYLLRAELINLAITDELTGLYNRRGFLSLTERQLKLGRRSGRSIRSPRTKLSCAIDAPSEGRQSKRCL